MAERERTNPLEWAVFGLGLVLTLGAVGFLAADALQPGTGPPELTVTLGAASASGSQTFVPVRVANGGGEGAEQVRIVVCDASGACEEIAFALVPRDGTREGVVGFAEPPGGRTFTAHVAGFQTR